MRLQAKPNLNGNSPQDFEMYSHDLSRAAVALRDKLAAFRAEIMHGRNYLTGGNREADLARINRYIEATYAAEQLGIEAMGVVE
jgi:hypothetical protein